VNGATSRTTSRKSRGWPQIFVPIAGFILTCTEAGTATLHSVGDCEAIGCKSRAGIGPSTIDWLAHAVGKRNRAAIRADRSRDELGQSCASCRGLILAPGRSGPEFSAHLRQAVGGGLCDEVCHQPDGMPCYQGAIRLGEAARRLDRLHSFGDRCGAEVAPVLVGMIMILSQQGQTLCA